jgi:hypothetical protein
VVVEASGSGSESEKASGAGVEGKKSGVDVHDDDVQWDEM